MNSLTFLVVEARVVVVVVVMVVVVVDLVVVVVVGLVVVVTRIGCCWNLRGEVLPDKEFSGQFSLVLSLLSGTLNSRPLMPG